jgi:RNA polymerase-binding transcription factor DksA
MNAMQEKLFLELRQTKVEIENSLKNKQNQDWFTTVLEEELSDISSAIKKLENGNFGQCEISGEFLPNELLNIIPTLRSQKDSEYLESYFKKPIYHSF